MNTAIIFLPCLMRYESDIEHHPAYRFVQIAQQSHHIIPIIFFYGQGARYATQTHSLWHQLSVPLCVCPSSQSPEDSFFFEKKSIVSWLQMKGRRLWFR